MEYLFQFRKHELNAIGMIKALKHFEETCAYESSTCGYHICNTKGSGRKEGVPTLGI